TLAGGEGQRIRLATQIGSSLVGVLYILDEPSIGLHQRDNRRLLDTLKRLRDLGNTVLVVEHDEETIRAADYVVDLGPGAGELGGHLVAGGTTGSRAPSAWTRSSTSTSRRSAGRRARTRRPTRACSPSSARSSPAQPRRACAATSPAASRSTSRAGGARPARATAS